MSYFFFSGYRITVYLEPLAIAANITQASFCRLDQVLLTFGTLRHDFQALYDKADTAEKVGCQAIIDSLELRWSQADQELFIAAIILNPIYQSSPLAKKPCFNLASLDSLLLALYRRFFGTVPTHQFLTELANYLHKTDMYTSLDIENQLEITVAHQEV